MSLRMPIACFRCLKHFQSLFNQSAMNDGRRKSLMWKWLLDVCQSIKMHIIVLRLHLSYNLWTMYKKFLFLLSIVRNVNIFLYYFLNIVNLGNTVPSTFNQDIYYPITKF